MEGPFLDIPAADELDESAQRVLVSGQCSVRLNHSGMSFDFRALRGRATLDSSKFK
jgi:hypothetical protein